MPKQLSEEIECEKMELVAGGALRRIGFARNFMGSNTGKPIILDRRQSG